MATYGELKAEIKRDARRDLLSTDSNADISDTTIEYYIKRSIDKYKYKSFWFNTAATNVSVTSGNNTASVPGDFLSDIDFQFSDGSTLRYPLEKRNIKEVRDLQGWLNTQGRPSYYAVEGDLFYFDIKADQDYAFPLLYLNESTTLANDTDENDWTTSGLLLIQFQTMAFINLLRLRDINRGREYQALADEEVRTLLAQNTKYRGSGKMKNRYM